MTVPYNTILRQIAIRANALVGATAATLQITYATSPLTSANFQSSIFPFTACQDAVVSGVERFANAIANTGNQTLRAYILSQTDPLASGDSMSSVDESGDPIIGIYGSVLDGDDPTIVCTAAPPQEIRRRLNTSAYWKIPVYLYSIDGNGITHTRDTVIVQCCVFNRATVAASVAANGNLLLADSLESGIVSEGVSRLVRDDEFMAQAQVYRSYADDAILQIEKGYSSVSQVSMPGPVLAQQSQ
jgi:hypothetical protein